MTRIRAMLHGAALCFRGFGLWARRPGLMLLGAVPAIIVGAVLIAVLVALGVAAPGIAEAVTPFASGWEMMWRDLVRIVVAVGVVAGAAALGVLTFAAVTLTVGQPFYERIWRAVERELGGIPDEVELPFWASVRRGILDGIRLLGVAILAGLLVFLLGLVPVVGTVLGWIAGAIVGGRALTIELTGMPADARGLSLDDREALLRLAPDVARGFGYATYLLFLIPGGAVLGTPAAVVGATFLVRELRGEATRPGHAAPPATGGPRGHAVSGS